MSISVLALGPAGFFAVGLLIFLFAGSWLAVIMSARIISGNVKTALSWPLLRPAPAIATSVVITALFLIVLGLSNRYWISFSGVIFFSYLVSMVDHIKYETALTHFLWSDLFKTSDSGKFRELVGHYIRPAVFGPILAMLAVCNVLLLWFLPAAPFAHGVDGSLIRLLAIGAGLALISMFRFYGVWVNHPICHDKFHFPEFTTSDYNRNVHAHGVFLAFLGHITTVAHEQDRPSDYSFAGSSRIHQTLVAAVEDAKSTNVDRYAANIPSTDIPRPSESSGEFHREQPTILVLAVEALWDITRVRGLTFSEDPLAKFRADYFGDARATCFAGLTSNTEFEFLTSLSMQFLHDSACPFIKIDRPVPALPAHLRKLGYATTAIHSYTRTFYNRDTVYPLLGFDRFLGLEELEKAGQAARKGWYMGDEALVQPIIDLLKLQSGPQLIYTLTMQNHGPYSPSRYNAGEIDPAAVPLFAPELDLSAGDRQAVINYTQGVRDAGRMYQSIRDYCSTLDRPILILAFGDHLPGLGENSGYRIFQKAGLITTVKDDALFAVPVFCWSNQAARRQGLAPTSPFNPGQNEQPAGFNTLGPWILRTAGLPMAPIHHLANACAVAKQKARSQTSDDLLRAYAWLQYDWLWGQGFIRLQEDSKSEMKTNTFITS